MDQKTTIFFVQSSFCTKEFQFPIMSNYSKVKYDSLLSSRYYVEKIQIMRSRSSNIYIPLPDVNGGNRFKSVTQFRYFFCKKETYIWDSENSQFFLLKGLDHEMPCEKFHDQIGLNEKDQVLRQLAYGPNDIIVPNHSIGYLLVSFIMEFEF